MPTYFLVLLGTIIIPFAVSFNSKIKFYKKWKFFFPAAIIVGIFFIAWDIYFTQKGVWGFNSKHVLGLFILKLPIEEWLFFICIPYACVFTYEILPNTFPQKYFAKYEKFITIILIIFSLAMSIIFHNKAYPFYTFSLLLIVMIINLIIKSKFLPKFYFAYLILFIPFYIVNGILTGSIIEQEVVWYNKNQIIGLRIGTIPLEDYFYGFLLILLIVQLYEYLKTSSSEKSN